MLTSATEIAQVRRAEQLKAECKLLRAIYRAARDFLDNRPGGTARALEATVTVYEAYQAAPARGGTRPLAGGRGAR